MRILSALFFSSLLLTSRSAHAFFGDSDAKLLCSALLNGNITQITNAAKKAGSDHINDETCQDSAGTSLAPFAYYYELVLKDPTKISSVVINAFVSNGAYTSFENQNGPTYFDDTVSQRNLPLANAMLAGGMNPNDIGVQTLGLSITDSNWLAFMLSAFDHGLLTTNLYLDSAYTQASLSPQFLVAALALQAKFPGVKFYDSALAYTLAELPAKDALDWAVSQGMDFESVAPGQPMSPIQMAIRVLNQSGVVLVLNETKHQINGSDISAALSNSDTTVFDYISKNMGGATFPNVNGQTETAFMYVLENTIPGGNIYYGEAATPPDADLIELLAPKQDLSLQAGNDTALNLAASKASLAVVQAVIQAGANPDQLVNGTDALYSALNMKKEDIALYLVSQTKNLDQTYPSVQNEPSADALMLAAQDGFVDVTSALLAANASTQTIYANLVNSEGQTALMYAASAGSAPVIEELAKTASLSVNAQDQNGTTALMDAVRANSLPSVLSLLAHGACVVVLDQEGHTAEYFASSTNETDIFNALHSYLQQPNHC